jgi:hypothetical protein
MAMAAASEKRAVSPIHVEVAAPLRVFCDGDERDLPGDSRRRQEPLRVT